MFIGLEDRLSFQCELFVVDRSRWISLVVLSSSKLGSAIETISATLES